MRSTFETSHESSFYMKPHETTSDPAKFIKAGKLAEMSGFSTGWLRKLSLQGILPKAEHGYYSRDAVRALMGYMQERSESSALAKERALLLRVTREKAQAHLALLRAGYLPKSEVGPILRDFAQTQREIFTRILEPLAERCAGIPPQAALAEVKAAVDAVCLEMSTAIGKPRP
jgi:hypothetical protein